jgi:7-keto-8-aminopelargonate synthetase-like enzyme
MTLEDRQRQAAYDWIRSAHIPPTSPARARLDLALLQAERDRQQRRVLAAMEADLIAFAKRGEVKEQE